jgi:hypothetical protein
MFRFDDVIEGLEIISPSGHTPNSLIALSREHFPWLGGRTQIKMNKNVTSGISEQQEVNSMIFPMLPLL